MGQDINIYRQVIEDKLKDMDYPKVVYHDNGILTISTKDFVVSMTAIAFNKALEEASKKYINE